MVAVVGPRAFGSLRPLGGTATAILSVTALVVALAGCGGGSKSTTPVTTPRATVANPVIALQQQYTHVVNVVSPSVVQVETNAGLGSGIVYDNNGDIVTNAHVVGQAKNVGITLPSGASGKGTVVGSFVPDDLAVIRTSMPGLQPASFGDSSQIHVGDLVLAVGNPLGLRSSVTDGIVSSLGRTVSEGNGVTLPSVIQTSAAINPGNSGGALVSLAAQVIGIPTLAAIDPELGGSSAPGIGFAIPSNTVKQIAPQLISSGTVTKSGRAYLGIEVATVVSGQGVLVVAGTPGGPAAKAGIQPRTVITSVARQPTPSTDALSTVLATLKPGQQVTLHVTDPSGASRDVKVTLGQLPGNAG